MPQCGEFTMRSYSAGGAAPRGLATRWAVTAAVCLLATGCTAQFKHLKNEPLVLATGDEGVVASTEAEDESEQGVPHVAATEAGLETVIPSPMAPSPVAPAPMTPSATADSGAADQAPRPFDAFLALNDPDIVASRSSVVKTAALTVSDLPRPLAADQLTEEQPNTTSTPDNGPQEPERLLPVVIPPPQQAGTSPAGQGTALAPTPGPMTVQNPYVRLAAGQVTSADDEELDVGSDEFILVEDGLEAVDTKRQAPGEFNAQPAKPMSDRVRDAADRPITSVGVNIQPPAGAMPEDLAVDLFTGRGEIRFDGQPQGATSGLAYFWQSPAFCHRPLYFEQPNLERYGRSIGPLDSALSAALFYVNVPAIPYRMVVDHPWACVYGEDYGAEGIGPRQKYLPPASLAAALAEASVMTGLVFLIP